MLRLSRKAIHAVEAVLDIAHNARPDPVQARDITTRQGVPQRYLEQVMQNLVRAGILRGVRGPRGGYRLARERRRISVAEIVRVVADLEIGDQEPIGPGSPLGEEIVRPLINSMHEELMAKLEAVTIDDLCRRAEDGGIAQAENARPDFTI